MNSHKITKIGTRVLHDTCYIVHQFQGQGHMLTSSVRLISASSEFGKQNAVPVSLEAGWGIPCWPNPVATLLVYHTNKQVTALYYK